MNRNQSLDALRGIAILLVLGRHYNYPGLWWKVGWSGVDLFFVLSGFLISGLLFDEYQRSNSINLKLFWIRRAFKIYPAFYAMLLFTVIVYWPMGRVGRNVFSDLFFLQDYYPAVAGHGWSLGVEEKFYFMLPVLLFAMMRFVSGERFRFIPHVFVVLFALCLTLRILVKTHGAMTEASMYPAHLRLDSLFAGVTLSYFYHFHKEEFLRAARWPLWVPGLVLLAPLAFWNLTTPWMDTIGFSMIAIGYGLIFVWCVDRTLPRPLFGAAWVGRFSYSIYLWHVAIRVLTGYDVRHSLLWLPVYLALCVGLGWLSAYLVETPFLALRDKLYPAQEAEARPD